MEAEYDFKSGVFMVNLGSIGWRGALVVRAVALDPEGVRKTRSYKRLPSTKGFLRRGGRTGYFLEEMINQGTGWLNAKMDSGNGNEGYK